jgi:hypothetical protein
MIVTVAPRIERRQDSAEEIAALTIRRDLSTIPEANIITPYSSACRLSGRHSARLASAAAGHAFDRDHNGRAARRGMMS